MSANFHRRLSAVEAAKRASQNVVWHDLSELTIEELRILEDYCLRLQEGEQVDPELLSQELLEKLERASRPPQPAKGPSG